MKRRSTMRHWISVSGSASNRRRFEDHQRRGTSRLEFSRYSAVHSAATAMCCTTDASSHECSRPKSQKQTVVWGRSVRSSDTWQNPPFTSPLLSRFKTRHAAIDGVPTDTPSTVFSEVLSSTNIFAGLRNLRMHPKSIGSNPRRRRARLTATATFTSCWHTGA